MRAREGLNGWETKDSLAQSVGLQRLAGQGANPGTLNMHARPSTCSKHPRRGVTLVEMLVTLAILMVMMTAIVQIFQAATSTLSASRAYQELDTGLRRLDGMIRSDFNGVTAKLTPPNNPKDNRGYFEYGENAFADLQGEDSDDYVRFTTKAPADRPFMGRFWPVATTDLNKDGLLNDPSPSGPISITSQYAEVIYFLRNGNLYRRVFLISPDHQKSIIPMLQNWNNAATKGLQPTLLGGNAVSWLGMNDISARPSATGNADLNGNPLPPVVLNTLGDLTNRENRAFAPRFANDFVTTTYVPPSGPTSEYYKISNTWPDQTPDDLNVDGLGNIKGDGVPDYYPTLYYDILPSSGVGPSNPNNTPLIYEGGNVNGSGNAPPAPKRSGASLSTMAFPYIFPGAYSRPDPNTFTSGWLHSPEPDYTIPNYLEYLQRLNHNPLDLGDNLPRPNVNSANPQNPFVAQQTWWGFPTWRETLSFSPATPPAAPSGWLDPTQPINVQSNGSYTQPPGLTPRNTVSSEGIAYTRDPLNNYNPNNDMYFLPPMDNVTLNESPALFSAMRPVPQLYSDSLGSSSVFLTAPWIASWEDDLVMTGVRSFDIKVLDTSLGDFVDLGWGDDARLPVGASYYSLNNNLAPFSSGNMPMLYYPNATPPSYSFLQYGTAPSSPGIPSSPGVAIPVFVNSQSPVDLLNATFAHEGRIPPLVADNRLDAQYPNASYTNGTFTAEYSAFPNYSSNIGDDNPNIVRLRRVWDSWSTDYSAAPASGFDPSSKAPIGPPFSPPVYPSYPPPYPAPLRGLQIQIRVQDPTGKYVKSLTIRQDFTEKL